MTLFTFKIRPGKNDFVWGEKIMKIAESSPRLRYLKVDLDTFELSINENRTLLEIFDQQVFWRIDDLLE